MKGIELAPGVVFDATDEEGRIIHTITGECLALDRIATILLQACLQQASRDDALAYVRARIDVSDEQLEEGLQAVIDQLLACGVIRQSAPVPHTSNPHTTPSEPRPPQANPMSSTSSSEEEQRNLLHTAPQQHMPHVSDWEVFLTGTRSNHRLPHLSPLTRLYAMGCMMTILILFFSFRSAVYGLSIVPGQKVAKWIQQREWFGVCRVLSWISQQSASSKLRTIVRETMIRLAHQELAFCHIFIKLFAPVGRCLVCSAALCAYLLAIGLPAQLVVGRAQFSLSTSFGFHAWVEIAGTVVND